MKVPSVNPRECEPCLDCESGYPQDYRPLNLKKAVMVAPDGAKAMLALGGAQAFLDGEDITDECANLDPDSGIVELYHMRDEDQVGLKKGVSAHHWAHRPPGQPDDEHRDNWDHVCRYLRRGDVRLIDKRTGEFPVWYGDPRAA